MLFLGTADDKTLEFPYGDADSGMLDQQRLILHHILFGTDPVLLEEGFVLASPEAVHPEGHSPFLSTAIGSGQVKVASREGDMRAYAAQRRAVRHAAPPDDPRGAAYVAALQDACVRANAFIQYPPSTIDETTFRRFSSFENTDALDALLDFAGCRLPPTFFDAYLAQYERGNSGKRWTARAAWEANLRQQLPNRPDVIHALMCKANRERQILRAAAIGRTNNIAMSVETGFEAGAHDLELRTTTSTLSRPDIAFGNLYPRVSASLAIKHCGTIFEKLSARDSALSMHRANFVHALNSLHDTKDVASVARAARHYEEEIYRAIGVPPIEENQHVDFVANYGVSVVLGAAAAALGRVRDERRPKLLFKEEEAYWKRRKFLGALCGVAAFGIPLVGIPVGKAVTPTIRLVRTTIEEDIGDLREDHDAKLGLSHQVLKIDAKAAKILL